LNARLTPTKKRCASIAYVAHATLRQAVLNYRPETPATPARLLSIRFIQIVGHSPAFFRNSAVNLLNLHYGLHCIALYGGGAFFLVYLLRAGLAVPGVLVSLALILVGRFAVRPLVIPPPHAGDCARR
jgi:hypothetical protein